MSPQRIIIQGGTATDALQDIKFQLSKLNQIVGTIVTTARATAVGTAGVSQLASKTDHKHPAAMATAADNISFTTSTAGILDVFARGDHIHFASPGSIPYSPSASNVSVETSTGGVANKASRGDHVHYLIPATDISNASWAAATAGLQSYVARGDHVHIIPHGLNTQPAGRTTSTVYTNNGSGPMWVMISLALSSVVADGAHLQVGGVDVAHGDANPNIHFFIAGIANPGSSYLLTATGGVHIEHWTEYGV